MCAAAWGLSVGEFALTDSRNGDNLRMFARSHPLRASLSEEMHARKLPHFAAPARLMQVVTHVGETGVAESYAHVAALCARHGAVIPAAAKHFVCRVGEYELVWERHTEVASYTFIRRAVTDPGFADEPFGAFAADWIAQLPGEVIRATQIAYVAHDPRQSRDQAG